MRSRRKGQADQVQLSLTTIDDPAFVSFRRLLHTGDYLVILKHKEKLVYDCIGIKANDETRESIIFQHLIISFISCRQIQK